MESKEHVVKWKKCSLCPLHKTASQKVMYRGDIPSDVLFIGQAPGMSEDVIGRPFVGPSGSLLQSIIDSVSARAGQEFSILITNTVACYPPKDRKPTTEEIKTCAPRLNELIEMAKPKAIVYVGEVAWRNREKLDVIQTKIPHPAHILRSGSDSAYLMKKAVLNIERALIGAMV